MGRYALCLHGLAFGVTDIGNKANWAGAFPYFKENVLGPNVDVFCHTWHKECPGEWGKLLEAYNPAGALCETQRKFPGCLETRSIYSRWYSAYQSVSMAAKYGQEQLPKGTFYDGVLLARYDLVFKTAFPWGSLDTSNSFWTPKWRLRPTPSSGYLDYWFYGEPFDMVWLASMYTEFDTWFAQGLKQNAHNVVGKRIPEMTDEYGKPVRIQSWGEEPDQFTLLRRLLGAKN